MRPSARVPALLALVLVATAACDRRPQQEALTTDPQTTTPADQNANRSPDEAAGVTARDVDGSRSSTPPDDSIEQAPPPEPPAR
ncbi:hypothetical protein ACF3M1_14430 [Luteimonas sp. WGS1318]|uniref:hypothetical protein n=1 Tax=Luteimonas sp. WGS1318 TaxID=3366815 RepID=UPI00372D6396